MDEINEEHLDDDASSETSKLNPRIIVKNSDPEKFVGCITKSADKLLGIYIAYSVVFL